MLSRTKFVLSVSGFLVLAVSGVVLAALILQANLRVTTTVADKELAWTSSSAVADTVGATMTSGSGGCLLTPSGISSVNPVSGITVNLTSVWDGSVCNVGNDASLNNLLYVKNVGLASVTVTGLDLGASGDYCYAGEHCPVTVLATNADGTEVSFPFILTSNSQAEMGLVFTVNGAEADPGAVYSATDLGILGG